ncbi:MAG TPA: HEAT repeat domain-containing protein [Longimicrobiaceae bacterium]|nr:HEAT repeat domain-containing protein [Longimicrobiaceae bacterium]
MERTHAFIAGAAGLLLLAVARPAHVQTIAEQVARAPDGVVRISFPSRPGVCGYGDGIAIRDPEGGEARQFIRWSGRGNDPDWEDRCEPGPVRVELRVSGGRVTSLHTTVGSGGGPVQRDLGMVPAAAAVDFLLDLAARFPGEEGDDAILPAALAAGVTIHPRLLRLAADREVPLRIRKRAVFWASQTGAPFGELTRLYARVPETEVREQVLFAYSQHDAPEAARELLRVARGDDPEKLRKTAVFWLGQIAGRAVTRDLGDLVEDQGTDLEVREHAVFALSQRPRGEAVPALIRIARENPSPRLRKRALFWLGQSGDPRALALFEELLARP